MFIFLFSVEKSKLFILTQRGMNTETFWKVLDDHGEDVEKKIDNNSSCLLYVHAIGKFDKF